jgi:MFS family permease
MPLVFLVVLLVRDWGHIRWRKIGAFVLGALVFLAVFLLLNFLPALDTLAEYGLLPRTFTSNNRIPILNLAEIWSSLRLGVTAYARQIQGSYLEQWTYPALGPLMLAAVIAVIMRPDRNTWSVVALLGMLIFVLLLIIPNHRAEYLFYLFPPLFLLAMQGLAGLPRHWTRQVVVVLVVLAIGCAYVAADVTSLRTAWRHRKANQLVGVALSELIDNLGGPDAVTVMACQEFHPFALDTRFRTYHSVITTGDLGESLDLIRPNIVVMHPRAAYVIGSYIKQWPWGIPPPQDKTWLFEHITQALNRHGYRRLPLLELTWDGELIRIYYKRWQPDTGAPSPP